MRDAAVPETPRDRRYAAAPGDELDAAKRELRRLRLKFAFASGRKSQATAVLHALGSKASSSAAALEALREEVERVGEEQVVFELARIEAVREFRAIQAQREEEEARFSSAMEKIREKTADGVAKVELVKEFETALADTVADVSIWLNRVQLVCEAMKCDSRASDLAAAAGELELARKRLDAVREEGFRTMASMDSVRSKLNKVTGKRLRRENAARRVDLLVERLSSELLLENSKFESLTLGEQNASSMATDLSSTLQRELTAAETSRNEGDAINNETEAIRAGILEAKTRMECSRERLDAALRDLKAVKSSEQTALENLRWVTERMMRERAGAAQRSSSISISRFEYQYLSGRAGGAEEVAGKKVAAAEGWVEALKASEQEMTMKMTAAWRSVKFN